MRLTWSLLVVLVLNAPAEAEAAGQFQSKDQLSQSKPKHPRRNGKTRKWYLLKKNRPPKYKKPVIYLYSDGATPVSVSFQPRGTTTYSYPQYDGKWEVTADKDGNLKDLKEDRQYPYLFWEGDADQVDFITENNQLPGYIVNTDSSARFLENVLGSLGLNDRERTDFITYWAPELVKHKFAFVQFLVDQDYSRFVSELTISPAPQAERKVFMLFTPVSSTNCDMKIVPQSFTAFERKGLVVVEWGGAIIENTKLKF